LAKREWFEVEFKDWVAFDFSYSLDLRSLIPHILAIKEYKATKARLER